MDLVKIMTHESIVHSQLLSLEKILARELKAELNLNLKGVRSHIIFKATPEEIERVKSDLGYKVYVRHNDEWIYDE